MGNESYIGSIGIFAGNFAPRNWAFCHGQTMAIQQNTALFSLVGTTYGGDGIQTFALPDLRGRVPVGAGQPGLSNYQLGQMSGSETTTLTVANLPAHSHNLMIADGQGDAFAANGNAIANVAINKETNQPNELLEIFNSAGAFTGRTLKAGTIGNTGGGQAFNSMPPYLALNFCICTKGVYPARG